MFTRSRNAPEWTVEEMVALVDHVAVVEDECGRDFSAHQKWEMVSSNLSSRSAFQCRWKWDSLVTQYHFIASHTASSYWSLDTQTKSRLGLPLYFDRELYLLIDNLLKSTDKRPFSFFSSSRRLSPSSRSRRCRYHLDSESDEDLDKLAAADDDDDDIIMKFPSGCEKVVQSGETMRRDGATDTTEEKQHECTTKNVMEIVTRLGESVDKIEAILKGELLVDVKGCGGQFSSPKLDADTNFTRWQADQLIQILGSLPGNIDRLNKFLECNAPS